MWLMSKADAHFHTPPRRRQALLPAAKRVRAAHTRFTRGKTVKTPRAAPRRAQPLNSGRLPTGAVDTAGSPNAEGPSIHDVIPRGRQAHALELG